MFKTIFKIIGLKVRLRWPEISEEPVHRRLQALDMAVRLGLFSADEARAMVVDAWGDKWQDFAAKAPMRSLLPLVVGGSGQSEEEKEMPNKSEGNDETLTGRRSGPGAPGPLKAGNSRSTTGPKQPDPMSRGDNELRDEESD